jgi:glutathione S-transferase
MILYGSSMSPFVRKVLAYAAEKGIELDVRPVGVADPDPGYGEASPFRKMPALRDGDFTIADSTAIIAYLEDTHPEPNLVPKEPRARARTIWFEEAADTLLCAAAGKMFFNRIVAPMFLKKPGDEALARTAQHEELPKVLDYLETAVPASGWLVDDRLTVADIAMASGFVNLMHLGVAVDPSTHPKLAAYVEKMLSRPSYAPWVAKEKAFFERMRAG